MSLKRHRSVIEHVTYGDVILERLKGAPALRKIGQKFANAQKALLDASDAATEKRLVRDDVLRAIGKADSELDLAVDALANALVAANITRRNRPFHGLAPFSPSELQDFPFAKEEKEVRGLIARIARTKPPAAVKKACDACTKRANAVAAALKALTGPQAAYNKALAARDAELPLWQKKLATLERHASVVFDEDPKAFAELFAPPGALQAPKKKAKKPAKKKTAATAPDTSAAQGVPPAPPSLTA